MSDAQGLLHAMGRMLPSRDSAQAPPPGGPPSHPGSLRSATAGTAQVGRRRVPGGVPGSWKTYTRLCTPDLAPSVMSMATV
jgi:hypothetical protein